VRIIPIIRSNHRSVRSAHPAWLFKSPRISIFPKLELGEKNGVPKQKLGNETKTNIEADAVPPHFDSDFSEKIIKESVGSAHPT
jgi:hypothetical protein